MLSEAIADARECLNRGTDIFLLKPIQVEKLHKAAGLCCQKRKIPRENLRAPFIRPDTFFFEDKYYSCQAITLSEGGIYLRRGTPLPVGTPVEVEMTDVGGKVIKLNG